MPQLLRMIGARINLQTQVFGLCFLTLFHARRKCHLR